MNTKMKRAGIGMLACLFIFSGCKKTASDTYIDDGMALLESYEYDSAISKFESSIVEGRNVMQAYRGLGIACLGKGEYQEAIENFSLALLEKEANKSEVKKDLLFYKAAAEYSDGDFGSAVNSYSKILELDDEKDAYYLRGRAYLAQGSVDEAKADYDKAISLAPDDYDMYIGMYESFNEEDRTDDGIEYLRKALQSGIAENEEENAYNIGLLYYYMGDYESAKGQLGAALEAGNTEAGLILGTVYLSLGDTTSALSSFQRYNSEAQESSRAYNGIVLCKLEEEDYEGALTAIRQGLNAEDDGGMQSLRFNEIVVYERMGDFDTAKEKAKEYTQIYPNDQAGIKEYEFLETR